GDRRGQRPLPAVRTIRPHLERRPGRPLRGPGRLLGAAGDGPRQRTPIAPLIALVKRRTAPTLPDIAQVRSRAPPASAMHFADNVDYPPLLGRPIVFLPALALLFEALRWWSFGSTAIGRGLSDLLHLSGLSPTAENIAVAALATLFIGFNLGVVMRLKLRWQVYVVWLELALLILVFFYSFNLSFDFIRRKIGFLLTQGLTMTL